ncbi:hypothetical protein NW762_013764 [Fusarium torreyae]|uniref:Uncharacterized protein n=1 Tax=Fusarium torreyae TaxID=1237075 RepID=A0A9W8RLC6_9HYPO|nr:hypothetical protein NW762_013764 [Fusarium torreyae]
MTLKTLLLVTAMAVTGYAKNTAPTIEKNLNFIYSRGDFATVGGTSGNEFGHRTGLTITDADGKELYSESYPGGASPCANPNMELRITSSCWEGEFKFNCAANVMGVIQNCDVVPSGDGLLSWPGKVDSSTEFVGIAISQTDVCGGGFPTGGECGDGATFNIASHNP